MVYGVYQIYFISYEAAEVEQLALDTPAKKKQKQPVISQYFSKK
jgi:hypothetical protein